MGLPSPTTVVNNVTNVIKQGLSLLRPVKIQEVKDAHDIGGLLLMAGDKTNDGTIDLRLYAVRVVDGNLVAHEVVPAENVPITKVLAESGRIAALLPPPAGVAMSIAVGAAAGGSGLLERLALTAGK